MQSGLALSIFSRDEIPADSKTLDGTDGFPPFAPVTMMLLVSHRLRDPGHGLLAKGLAEMLALPT